MRQMLALFGGVASIAIVACVGDSLTLPKDQCDAPNQFCGSSCTDTQTDPRNCGGCGKQCNTAAGETCQKGTCGPPCTGGTSRCGMACLDVQNDPQNCGDCGKKCGVGEACSQGKCSLLCRSGLNACPRSGAPPMMSDAGAGEGGASDAGGMSAGNECVDFQTDSDNCGKCGNKCPSDKPFCDFGTCKLYKWTGILTNLNQDDLSGRWTECFTETYQTNNTSIVGTVLTKCPQANLLLACRQQGSKTLVTAAEAPRADVIFDTGQNYWNVHVANGTAWYYNTNYSWGYAMPGDGVTHFTCDVSVGLYPERRLCWHAGGGVLQNGYRCGTNTNPQGYERVIFQTP